MEKINQDFATLEQKFYSKPLKKEEKTKRPLNRLHYTTPHHIV